MGMFVKEGGEFVPFGGGEYEVLLDSDLNPYTVTTANISKLFRKELFDVVKLDDSHPEDYTSLRNYFEFFSYLEVAPYFDTSLATNVRSMFRSCFELEEVPEYDFSSVENSERLFQNCRKLERVHDLVMPNSIDVREMFDDCRSLESISSLTISSSITSVMNMFRRCYELEVLPWFDTSNVTVWDNAFTSCESVIEVPAYDMSSGTSMSNVFGSSGSTTLQSCSSFKAFGAKYGFDLRYTKLDASGLNEVFTNLGIPAGSQTINVSNNPGSATCDPSIATSKGWTVIT